MKLYIKSFSELTNEELYGIYYIRTAVFVVEQNCPYQEVDENDRIAWHLWYEENSEILAYCRVYPKGDIWRIGRVLSARRRRGLGSQVLKEAISFIRSHTAAKVIELDAQSYAIEFYEKQGFKKITEEFMEDGIPHITMRLEIENE